MGLEGGGRSCPRRNSLNSAPAPPPLVWAMAAPLGAPAVGALPANGAGASGNGEAQPVLLRTLYGGITGQGELAARLPTYPPVEVPPPPSARPLTPHGELAAKQVVYRKRANEKANVLKKELKDAFAGKTSLEAVVSRATTCDGAEAFRRFRHELPPELCGGGARRRRLEDDAEVGEWRARRRRRVLDDDDDFDEDEDVENEDSGDDEEGQRKGGDDDDDDDDGAAGDDDDYGEDVDAAYLTADLFQDDDEGVDDLGGDDEGAVF